MYRTTRNNVRVQRLCEYGKNYAQGNFLRYQTPRINWRVFYTVIGEGYNAEVGFVQRTGVSRYGSRVSYLFYPEGAIQNHGPEFGYFGVSTTDGEKLDGEWSGSYGIQFLNNSEKLVDED